MDSLGLNIGRRMQEGNGEKNKEGENWEVS